MGKAYTAEQREQVRGLLEQGKDEETIEKTTGVSDRTIRRWKLELERTGRIGKPPESRTGRHRVLSAEIEAALFEYTKDKPNMSVDDMLWWLYDNYQIVVGTRTIRRVFERKGDKVNTTKGKGPPRRKSGLRDDGEDDEDDEDEEDMDMGEQLVGRQKPHPPAAMPPPAQNITQYQSPYAPVPASTQTGDMNLENQLRQAMQQTPQHPYPAMLDLEGDLPEDEETVELQLQQIALQKREVELKLKLKRLKGTPDAAPPASTSTLYNPTAVAPPPNKRDSRSKKKIEESKRRTAERQERMLRDLERRSRRRDHLTAEWVESKDIWPLRAQGMLADLMHQYGLYTYTQTNDVVFNAMYNQLYTLVDLTKNDWDTDKHDEMLRERTKRKMAQLRTKMQKTGEIINRGDGYPGFEKAQDYTGEQAGAAIGDESEMVQDPALQAQEVMQAQPGAPNMQQQHEEHFQYEPMQDHQQIHQGSMQYPAPMMHPQEHYPMIDQHQAMPYAQMGGQQGLGGHQDGLVM